MPGGRWTLARVISALLAILSAAAPATAEEQRFREVRFPAGPRIMDRIHVDLDGDGAKDLLLVRGREVSVYLQRDGGFRPDAPDQRFNFVDSAILWDDGDVDGDGRPEILFLTGEGVQYYRWENGRLSFVPHALHAAAAGSILKAASAKEIRHKDFYSDLDGDGIPDLLLPGEGCYLLLRGRPAGGLAPSGPTRGVASPSQASLPDSAPCGFAPADTLVMRPEVLLSAGDDSPTSQALSAFWYPQPVSGDFDGDGRRDLFIHQLQRLLVFTRRPDGGYGPNPTFMLPLEFTGPLDEGRFKVDFQLPTKIADIDGDGLTDVVATHVGRATTYVFRGRKDRRDLRTPDVVLKLKGLSFLDFLVDLDGDGRRDLMLARTDRPGLWDLMKILVTKEIPVEVLFFYSSGDALFERSPNHRRDVQIPLLFSSARRGVNVGTSAVITVLGDLTGDGLNDLLLRAADDRLAVYAGKKGRGFSEKPDFTIRVADMDGYRFLEPVTEDVNGDGIADVSLAYYSWDGKADRVSMLLSPGKPPAPPKPAVGMAPAGDPKN